MILVYIRVDQILHQHLWHKKIILVRVSRLDRDAIVEHYLPGDLDSLDIATTPGKHVSKLEHQDKGDNFV